MRSACFQCRFSSLGHRFFWLAEDRFGFDGCARQIIEPKEYARDISSSPSQYNLSKSMTLRAICAVEGRVGPCVSGEYVVEAPVLPPVQPQVHVMAGVGLLLEKSENR